MGSSVTKLKNLVFTEEVEPDDVDDAPEVSEATADLSSVSVELCEIYDPRSPTSDFTRTPMAVLQPRSSRSKIEVVADLENDNVSATAESEENIVQSKDLPEKQSDEPKPNIHLDLNSLEIAVKDLTMRANLPSSLPKIRSATMQDENRPIDSRLKLKEGLKCLSAGGGNVKLQGLSMRQASNFQDSLATPPGIKRFCRSKLPPANTVEASHFESFEEDSKIRFLSPTPRLPKDLLIRKDTPRPKTRPTVDKV